MVTAKVWKLAKRPDGEPKRGDFECVEEQLICGNGDVITEAEFLSVDPYMRYKVRQIPLNSTVVGTQIARVIESKNPDWPVGTYVVSPSGWRTHTRLTEKDFKADNFFQKPMKLPEMGDLPKSLGLGILGMPGNTAYFGLLDICQPKAGETVLVNAAAGAVGSAVIQIAKIKGCKVIAFAGSEEKVAWTKELGADHAFNYKTTDIGQALSQAAPEKIHCFFENVGGQFTAEALPHMAERGRMAICGVISEYNDNDKDIGVVSMCSPLNQATLLWKELKVEGFIVTRWFDRWMEGIDQLKQWIVEGKLKYKETTVKGFDKMPEAFIGLFRGDNTGKAIVIA
ncbi:protaglandin reductase 1 [Penaeus vannamei]|uniref:Prostaglandin reductase 1 n=1 Tax=Penaeus vannamei TaxID=6689 RepID=A0A423TER0_PENVA|nr:prostaglandin reductase 1-like [Penaeus vannamei]ROT74916.1 protaglandin reductase 1 [Penaeus vannamei]